MPQRQTLGYKGLTLNIKPVNLEHIGVFSEQAANWDFAMERIRSAGWPVRVLNLFVYIGAISVACVAAGAAMCHVDATKGMVSQTWENAAPFGLSDAPIRWIVDDCAKFMERRIRRGRRYGAVIMDPLSHGQGPSGEIQKLEENLFPFMELVVGVLSDEPLFFLVSSYTTGLTLLVLTYLLETLVACRYGGRIESQELDLPVTVTDLALPCGASDHWTAE